MADILNRPVLALNKGWTPIHIRSVKEAIRSASSDCAKIIDTKDDYLSMYTWNDWIQLLPGENEEFIRTAKLQIRIPEVIVLTDYSSIPEMEIRLTRRNLLLRDDSCCQYCGKKVTNKDFTIDHIVPRSHGGKNSWENFVVACFPCNIKKRNRTPKEAGMPLKTKPIKPNWYPLASRYNCNSPASWKKFLPKDKTPVLSV